VSDYPWTCDDCGDPIDEGETLCEECSDRRYEEWHQYQDWLSMSDRERAVAIFAGGCGPGRQGE
jgi:hypothetical protein